MSEKRFEKSKSDITEYRIYDNEKEDAYFIDCEDESTVDAIVDLLNEQHLKTREQEQMIRTLQCSIDALNYVLRYVKGIEVEIDINK